MVKEYAEQLYIRAAQAHEKPLPRWLRRRDAPQPMESADAQGLDASAGL